MSVAYLSDIYSRASWGARYRAGFADISANQPFGACWTHHSVTAHLSPNASVAQEKAQMRILEDIGQQRFNGGISYTYVIFPSGRVYMGTGASRRGAHTGGHNSTSIAVCFAGNYENNKPTAAAERGYARLLQGLRSAGVLRQARTNGGHKDAPGNAWNACPGRHLHARLGAINRLAAGNLSTPPPTPAAPSPLEGDIMSPREFWSYLNKSVDKRQVYRILRDTDANARDTQRRIRRADWRTWLANGVNGFRSAPLASLSNRWSLREDGYRLRSWVQYAYLWGRRAHDMAQQGRNEGREHHAENQAGIAALADQLDSLKPGLAKAVKDAMAEGREEQVRITAAEVAAELEADTRISVKDEDDDPDTDQEEDD